jgi:hypothetical protein
MACAKRQHHGNSASPLIQRGNIGSDRKVPAVILAGLPGPLHATSAAGHGTRSAIAATTARPAPSPRCGQPPTPAGAITLRDLTVRGCTIDAEPLWAALSRRPVDHPLDRHGRPGSAPRRLDGPEGPIVRNCTVRPRISDLKSSQDCLCLTVLRAWLAMAGFIACSHGMQMEMYAMFSDGPPRFTP